MGLIQEKIVAEDRWIIEGDLGHYDAVDVRLRAADTIILLDFSLLRCALRAIRRSRERSDFWFWLIAYRYQSLPIGETDVVPFSEEEIEKILKARKEYTGPNKGRLVVLTDLMLATGLAIGDATMLSKNKVIKNDTGWYVELRTAKTGTAVSCPIPHNLGKAFHALDGETPFWTGKSDLDHLTKTGERFTRRYSKRLASRASSPVPAHSSETIVSSRTFGVSCRHAARELGRYRSKTLFEMDSRAPGSLR
jgi:integrase